MSEKPVFCILCGGPGTRMGQFTSNINKALLPVGEKPAIAHIIDKVPKDIEIVLSLGYQKESVIEFCEAAYPDRKFIYVHLENLNGPRSGPGNGLSECREHLQRPFWFCTNDCLFDEEIPDLSTDWIGVHKTTTPQIYSTANVDESGRVIEFVNKSDDGFPDAFIGIAGIKDYETFWRLLDIDRGEPLWEVVGAFYEPLEYKPLKAIVFSWHDTGNPEAYQETVDFYSKKNNVAV